MSKANKNLAMKTDMRTEVVNVPEWGGKVLLTSLSFRQQSKFAEEGKTNTGDISIVKLCINHILDLETKEPFFDKGDMDYLLDETSGKVLSDLFMKILELSGMAEASEELEKN